MDLEQALVVMDNIYLPFYRLPEKAIEAIKIITETAKASQLEPPVGMPSENSFGQWIDVEKELPEIEVIALGYQNEMLIGYIHKTGNIYECESAGEVLTEVKKWMPLPKP